MLESPPGAAYNRLPMPRLLVLLLAALPLAAQERAPITLATADRSFPVRSLEIRPKEAGLVVEFEEANGTRGSLDALDVVEIGVAPPAPRATAGPDDVQVFLRTGDVLVGALGDPGADAVKLESASLGAVEIPFDRIDRVEFLSRRSEWLKAAPAMKSDTLLLSSGDRPSGTLRSVGRGEAVYYNERRKKEISVKTRELSQVFLMPVGAKPPSPPATLHGVFALVDGGSVQGVAKSFQAGRLVFADLYGTERTVPAAGLSAVYFRNGRVIYLSDTPPARVDENANYLRAPEPGPGDLAFPWQRDANAGDGGKLSIRGREFRKGLGVHARSELTWKIDGAFRRFQATIGIDDHAIRLTGADPAGNASFVVLADGKVLHRRDGVTSRTAPIALDLDVTGAKELTLLADFGEDRSGQADFADWALARLIR